MTWISYCLQSTFTSLPWFSIDFPPGMQRRSYVPVRSHIDREVANHAETSSRRREWYVNETDLLETYASVVLSSNQPIWDVVKIDTNWYLSETDQLNTSQRRHSWYLNETHVFEILKWRSSWYLKETVTPEMPKKSTA